MPPAWAASDRVLLHGGTVYSPVSPFATAMLIDAGVVAWLGEDSAAAAHRDAADHVVDLRGSLVTPGFVDAHVHSTSTGLTLTGLDLSAATSLGQALTALEAHARLRRGGVIIGHGWDDTAWPEQRPPTRSEIDRATWGSVVYLSRRDVHSAAVSSALVAMVPDVRSLAGYDDVAPLSQAAHHAVRGAALATITAGERRRAQRAMRAHAGSLGIVALHEMAGPHVSSQEDLVEILTRSREEPGPLVTGFWGELAATGGIERARAAGAYALGGDLTVDGALGSRTACLRDPYADAPGTLGAQYLDVEAITNHVVAATEAGLPSGFHVIGDRSCALVLEGLTAAAQQVGADVLRRLNPRLEHAEMLSDVDIAAMARLGVTASMQPMFDRLWGGTRGMYEVRLGSERAGAMNRVADLVRAGVTVAFGSDAPVTDLGPWAAVRAAVHHTSARQRVSARAAFSAHTRAGWRSVGDMDAGVLAPGSPAHYAIWSTQEVVVQAPDDRLSAWSTDPRSGTPGLPALDDDTTLPTCLRTVVHGHTVFDSGALEA
ncbi:MAG: amidohydrolase family protein [Actinobacteria bacterium]|nr:amidohydrolase family protein [Actinomycetota bacterium]